MREDYSWDYTRLKINREFEGIGIENSGTCGIGIENYRNCGIGIEKKELILTLIEREDYTKYFAGVSTPFFLFTIHFTISDILYILPGFFSVISF